MRPAEWPERIRRVVQPIADAYGFRVDPRISSTHDAIVIRFMREAYCECSVRMESEQMMSAVSDPAFDDLVRMEARRCLERYSKEELQPC